jgi:hypothetical protein
MDTKFIKCQRAGMEKIYFTNSDSNDIIHLIDKDYVYLRLCKNDIKSFKFADISIVAEVEPDIGNFPVETPSYRAVTPIIIIPTNDVENLESFGELVEIRDICSKILERELKD